MRKYHPSPCYTIIDLLLKMFLGNDFPPNCTNLQKLICNSGNALHLELKTFYEEDVKISAHSGRQIDSHQDELLALCVYVNHK